MTSKIKVKWGLTVGCACAFASATMLGNGVSQKAVPIGVQIYVANEVTTLWGDPAKQSIPAGALTEFLGKVRTHLVHWDFEDQATLQSVVTLTLAATMTARDELFMQTILHVPGYKDKVLAQELWLENLTRTAAYPSEESAKSFIESFIDRVFPDLDGAPRQIPFDLDTLCQRAPLAKDPRWLDPVDKTFVLPLSRGRFSHLRWSVFRLHSDTGNPSGRDLTVITSEDPDDHWEQYCNVLTEALKVKSEGNTTKQPNNYKPVRVYLEAYKPDVDRAWGT